MWKSACTVPSSSLSLWSNCTELSLPPQPRLHFHHYFVVERLTSVPVRRGYLVTWTPTISGSLRQYQTCLIEDWRELISNACHCNYEWLHLLLLTSTAVRMWKSGKSDAAASETLNTTRFNAPKLVPCHEVNLFLKIYVLLKQSQSFLLQINILASHFQDRMDGAHLENCSDIKRKKMLPWDQGGAGETLTLSGLCPGHCNSRILVVTCD